jgi:hypothetical protein
LDLKNPVFIGYPFTAVDSTATGILNGSFLGGDASPRLIQVKGTFTF